jgi:predicted DNA-binding transcriptional regulator AlpA
MSRDRLLRLPKVLEILPISKSTWWAGLKSGRYNIETIKLGPRTTAWRESDVLKIVEQGVQSKG